MVNGVKSSFFKSRREYQEAPSESNPSGVSFILPSLILVLYKTPI